MAVSLLRIVPRHTRQRRLPRPAKISPIGQDLFATLCGGIDYLAKDEDYARPSDSVRNTAERGRMILISVNSPGWVSTSIEPPCCLTMMSWLMP